MSNRWNVRTMANVVQRIRFPPEARIDLIFHKSYSMSSKYQITTFLDAATFACGTLGEDSIQCLSVTGSRDQLLITGWAMPIGGAPRQSIRIWNEVQSSDISLAHLSALACLPLASVHSLWIAGTPCAGMAGYLTLPRLQRIGLHGSCAWITEEAMKSAHKRGTSAFNRVDVFALDAVDFNERSPADRLAGIPSVAKQESTLPSLLASFITRGRDQGAPLHTLILDGCKHIPEGLKDLFAAEKGRTAITVNTRSKESEREGVWTGYGKRMTQRQREAYHWLHLRDREQADQA